MSLSQILLIPGIGQMSFRDALSILSPYSPRLAANYMDPVGSLYTDASRTTQVTAVGNRIRSFTNFVTGGPHGSASSDAKSPLFARRPATGRRNLLERTEEFANVYWEKVATGINTAIGSSGIEANVEISPYGDLTADRVNFINQTDSDVGMRRAISATGGQAYTFSVWLRGEGSDIGKQVRLRLRRNTSGTGSFITSTATLTAGWVRYSVSLTLAADNVDIQFVISSTTSQATSALIWGAQLERSATATNYQRVVTSADITEAGVRDVYSALFDGSDDCLQVSGFDLSDTDEVCVIAGVRKLSDAARGVICELTATIASNNGAFNLTAPNAGSDTFAFESKGTTLRDAVATGSTSPISRHLTGIGDISGDLSRLIVNATSTSNTSDQGTGNYSNSTLNIGGRNNSASLPFNGAISYLFVLGAIPPDDVLTRIYRGLAPQIGVSV